MKIGINARFLAAPEGGVQRFAREVTERLADRVDVTLYVPGGIAVPESLDSTTRVERGLTRGHPWEQVELPLRFRRGGLPVLFHPANTGTVAGRGHVVAIHDLLALERPQWFTRRYALWCRVSQGLAARRADAVLVPSRWTGDELRRLLGVPQDRIRRIAQGTGPFSEPASEVAVDEVRRRWNLPDDYLLTSGAGDPRKNLEFLVRVAEEAGRRRQAPVTVVAVGGEMPWIHRDGRWSEGRPAHLVELGYVTDADLRALYTGAAAFCFPSLAEGFGRPPLEAMACGTPAVVAPYGPAREVLGEAARIVPLDPGAWADVLLPLLEDSEERRRWSDRGREIARGHTWERVVDRVLRVCETVARS